MFRRLAIHPVVALIVLALLPAWPAMAEAVFPPGMRVGLTPPPGMVLSTSFPGFEDSAHKAAITILELPPQLYSEVEKSVFITELNKPEVKLDKRQSFPFNDGMGYLANFHVTLEGKTFYRWIFLGAAAVNPVPDLVTLITVQVPAEALSAYPDDTVLAALRSVTFRPTPLDEQIGLLPFKLEQMADFRIVRTFQRAGILLTAGPNDDDDQQPQVFISVGPGGPQQVDDRGRFSQNLLRSSPVMDLNVLGAEALRIGGQPGSEIRAEAKTPNGTAITLVQWVRFAPGGYLRMLSVARKQDWNENFPKFRAIRDGIKFR